MRDWFPFTDYDFFGYLVSGFTLVFAFDFVFNDGAIMLRDSWTFVQGVLAFGVAYFTGQITAWPASLIIEHLLARRVLLSPTKVMLSDGSLGWATKLIGILVVGRYYQPLPTAIRRKIIERAAAANDTTIEAVEADPELVFAPAFQVARQNADASARIDNFRNQYGLNRNMAFATLVTAGLLHWGPTTEEAETLPWVALALVLTAGLTARFLKFYAAFAAEVLRAFAYREPRKDHGNADDT